MVINMIISASRRTDIPSYYAKWFLERIRAGYVYVRNPMNAHQVSRVSLSPDVVDGIVFWTKNPLPMLDKLDALHDYMYYFQFTLTSYGADVERNVPSKSKVIIPAFQRLADRIGRDRVIWRYDPIFLSGTYTMEYHIRYFEELAKRLSPYTRKCTISFLDFYRNTGKNMAPLALRDFSARQQAQLAKSIAGIAHSYGLQVDTCAEGLDLQRCGVGHAQCIDGRLFGQLLQCPLQISKDKNQRPACGCMESLDIGAYNTCLHGCRYCYANHAGAKTLEANHGKHRPSSPLLMGELGPGDRVVEREMHTCREAQLRLE